MLKETNGCCKNKIKGGSTDEEPGGCCKRTNAKKKIGTDIDTEVRKRDTALKIERSLESYEMRQMRNKRMLRGGKDILGI